MQGGESEIFPSQLGWNLQTKGVRGARDKGSRTHGRGLGRENRVEMGKSLNETMGKTLAHQICLGQA